MSWDYTLPLAILIGFAATVVIIALIAVNIYIFARFCRVPTKSYEKHLFSDWYQYTTSTYGNLYISQCINLDLCDGVFNMKPSNNNTIVRSKE